MKNPWLIECSALGAIAGHWSGNTWLVTQRTFDPGIVLLSSLVGLCIGFVVGLAADTYLSKTFSWWIAIAAGLFVVVYCFYEVPSLAIAR